MRNKEMERHRKVQVISVLFFCPYWWRKSFLALAVVSKQKAAMWWVWLAADGEEISGRAVRWMPSWLACDVQFVARALLGRKALKILLAVTQREMWFNSKKGKKKKPSTNTFFICYRSFFTASRTWFTELNMKCAVDDNPKENNTIWMTSLLFNFWHRLLQ